MYDIARLVEEPEGRLALRQVYEDVTGRVGLLSSVKIKLTSFCNLRCQMCGYWKTKRETALTTEQWQAVLQELAEMGCRKVHFSGGEVFLRRDFLDLVEWGSSLGLKVNLTTNGTLINQERLRRLVKAKPNSISISLDGPKPEIHDVIRGIPGSFARTTGAIRQILKFGQRWGRAPKIRINFVVQRQNYRVLPRMVEVAHQLGACELHPMPVDEKGERKNRLSRSQIERYNAEVAPVVAERRRQAGFSLAPALVYPFGRTQEEIRQAKRGLYSLGHYEKMPCWAPWLHLFIGWDGECYLCCMTNGRMDSLGNVATLGVRGVFLGEAMAAVRQRFRAGKLETSCSRCDMFLPENLLLQGAMEQPCP